MYGLEYALLFGIPKNRPELIHGRSRCAFPFLRRDQAEAHFADWTETLCRWKGITSKPAVEKKRNKWTIEAAGFRIELSPLPISLQVPLDSELFMTFMKFAWRRDCWPGQPAGIETGWEWAQRHFDVGINLWTLFGALSGRHGGQHCGSTNVYLSDTTVVIPDQFYFSARQKQCATPGHYYQGVPDVITEVLSPASRPIDRGPRMQLYCRLGVPRLWLLDPELETIETYELAEGNYQLTGTYRPSESFTTGLFPGERLSVAPLFETQEKRWRRHDPSSVEQKALEPIPEWLAPPERRLGLEYLFILGHPEHRYELWDNRSPCVLPFGSPAEARHRFRHFAEEASAWEQQPLPRAAELAVDSEQAEIGRFRLTRRGRLVSLDVSADGRLYRELSETWSDRRAWNWGE